jgi:phosphoesterase RecJ-like protein
MIQQNELEHLKQLLSTPQQISIVTHTNPDGDAIGSSLGLYHYLIQKKHKVKVIVPNAFPHFLAWMNDSEKVIDYERQKEDADDFVQTSDILFMLDFNNLQRIDNLADAVEKSDAFKILIDHHQQPDIAANITVSDISACSTCQMIFEIIDLLGDKNLINVNSAECLYCGIMTDTASFRFDTTSAKTHRIVAQLIEIGIVKSKIHGAVYDKNTLDKLQLVSYCLCNNLKLHHNNKIATITFNAEEQKKYNMQKGDTEGLVNHGLSVDGVLVSAFFTERDGMIKISFRSKGKIDVNAFARKYFEGGGHVNAAGAKSNLSIEKTLEKFIELSNELV